jgi:hypothetical protein
VGINDSRIIRTVATYAMAAGKGPFMVWEALVEIILPDWIRVGLSRETSSAHTAIKYSQRLTVPCPHLTKSEYCSL